MGLTQAGPAEGLRDQALASYRTAYRATVKKQLAVSRRFPSAEYDVSAEAGEGVLRLLAARPRGAEKKVEVE